ncbi:MAG: hypothetical protein U0795_15555 [Pirellulales bacterium]
MAQELATRNSHVSLLKHAQRQLAVAKTFEDFTQVRDQADMVRQCAKAARLGLELVNEAAEIKLRAERAAGKTLADLKLRGGDRRSPNQTVRVKLENLGVSQNESTRWQQEASISDDQFEKFLEDHKIQRREITSAALLRAARAGSPPRHTRAKPVCRTVSMSAATLRDSAPLPPATLDRFEEVHAHLETIASLANSLGTATTGRRAIEKGLCTFASQALQLARELLTELRQGRR